MSPRRARRDFYSIHYPRPAVGIVAIQDEKVLLIRHYRYLIDKVGVGDPLWRRR